MQVSADGTRLTATLKTKSGGPKASRVWDVQVTNTNDASATLPRALTIQP